MLRELGTSPAGLSSEEAHARLLRHGPNRLPIGKGPSALALVAKQITNPLLYALIASGAVALAIGEVADGAVVLAVVVLNALFGFVQEYRAGQAIAALSELVAEPARARRDGEWVELPAEAVVPGDLLAVQEGERVAADMRLLETHGLRTQEAALTGESTPVDKGRAPVAESTPLAERRNLLYAGTLVAAGTGHGIAVATGPETEIGRISALLEQTHALETPLTRELDRVGRAITMAIGAAAVLLALAAAVRGFPLADAALAGVSMAVAAVPEGLPAVVTIALAVGVQRMARRRAVVRHLPAVETLGSTTVVASDKTGTLTQNRLNVESIWSPSGDEDELHRAAVLCNDAVPEAPGEVRGDPTEAALLRAAVRAGVDVAGERSSYPRLGSIPFEAERKFMATLHRDNHGGAVLYAKGAPEVLLPRCRDVDVARVQREVDRLTEAGQRVLLFAARDGHPVDQLDEGIPDLRLLGLEGLMDPPRPEAFEAVEACRRAGVRVLLVTGDHPRTAGAVARTLGISEGGALTGPEMEDLDEESLRPVARRVSIYARAAPKDKLKLIRALQGDGEVVAVTGDGVNDAPALQQAALGVAMGRAGTATAKEAADMVLTDDNFATLRAAIEEGRRVYDNLVKALAFILPTSLGQALMITVAVLAFPLTDGEPQLPVEPIQILWINLIVAVALALPLALEAPEPDLMDRPPRRPGTPLLDTPMLVRTLAVAVTLTAVALGVFELEHQRQLDDGVGDQLALARAQTTAVTTAVIFQAFYLLTCRSLIRPNREIGRWSNPAIYAGILAVLLLQVAFVTLPPMHDVFGSADLDLRALALAVGAALLVFPVTWIEERWRVRRISATAARRRGPAGR